MSFSQATFEGLQRRNPGHARRYAGLARAAAAKKGRPAPSWAASAMAVRSPVPIATADERALTSAIAERSCFETPPLLVDWRRAESGRVVSVDARGAVTLIEYRHGQRFEAAFTTCNAALYAIATGELHWVARRPRTDPVTGTKRARQ